MSNLMIEVRGAEDWLIKASLMEAIPNVRFDIWHKEPNPETMKNHVVKLGGVRLYLSEKAIRFLDSAAPSPNTEQEKKK